MLASSSVRVARLATSRLVSSVTVGRRGYNLCRRCLAVVAAQKRHQFAENVDPSPKLTTVHGRRYQSSDGTPHDQRYLTGAEASNTKMLESARRKVEDYRRVAAHTAEDASIDDQKARAKTLKYLRPLAAAWENYENLRKALLDVTAHLTDPDPTLREMFAAEHASLQNELDKLVTTLLPSLLLPPLPTASLPVMMTLNAGIGGGEASRFAEELSRMYMSHAEKKGWKTEIMSAVEGPTGKGSGSNGYREMTIKFLPNQWGGEGEECYGELMWEKGVHRVQRVPPGATVDKLHSSTVTIVVLPILPDTPDEPLFDPKEIKQEVMRSRGAGGQHVNKTESAVRLTHIPTGITVSMQDSRSQSQNRDWAYDVLRARLAERRRGEEEEARRATRFSQVRGANRGDKVRTYNFPQDRVTDHRIGYNASAIDSILSGDGFDILIHAMKEDFAKRRLEALLDGEEDLSE